MSPEAIRALVEERDTLREELRQLRETLHAQSPETWWRLSEALRLPPTASAMLALLHSRAPEAVSRDRLHLMRPGGHDVLPKHVDAFICQARTAIRRSGVRITVVANVWNYGFRVTPEGRAWLDARLDEHFRSKEAAR